ncbi:hypothetical protein [Streptomyces sp. NPDC060035]|uniref:hypothetical protein n=1 Tax=Streptomyces sp. NPDC060035 TaxID=3347044 RepID=UPI00367BBAD1
MCVPQLGPELPGDAEDSPVLLVGVELLAIKTAGAADRSGGGSGDDGAVVGAVSPVV